MVQAVPLFGSAGCEEEVRGGEVANNEGGSIVWRDVEG